MNFREEAYLMHYGILGMKWGKRKGISSREQAKSNKHIERKRSMYGTKAAEGLLKDASKNKKLYSKLTLKGYTKLIRPDDPDFDVKESFKYDKAAVNDNYKRAKKLFENSKVLEQKLSSIDTTSTKYKDVKKQVDDAINQAFNEGG